MTDIHGKDLKIWSRVKSWFMHDGMHSLCDTIVIDMETYEGPLEHLFRDGAKIIDFEHDSERSRMMVSNDFIFQSSEKGL
jgi:hypothetical protein